MFKGVINVSPVTSDGGPVAAGTPPGCRANEANYI